MRTGIPVSSSSLPARMAGKDTVVEGLIADLLHGRFAGGDRLTEAMAVARFGVSRTPVREALLELAGLGLLELRRNCGAVFLSFGPAEIREIYAVRSLLEVEAARLASGSIPAEALETLTKKFEEIRRNHDADPDWKLDRELHALIARAGGNRRLSAEIKRYGSLVQTIRKVVGDRTFSIHRTSADEHLRILYALSDADADGAANAMRQHLEQASRSACEAVTDIRRA